MRSPPLPKTSAVQPDEVLTVSEVASLLKVAEKTVYTMAQGFELPCFKVRGQWRFRRRDLDQWIAKQISHPEARKTVAVKTKSRRKGGRV